MIGVLALQGNFTKHIELLKRLGISSTEVRYPYQFNDIDGLVLPGGESSVISDLIVRNDLLEPIVEFSRVKPILATCAGIILMSKKTNDSRVIPLNIFDIEINRNAYGRQIHSFVDTIQVDLNGTTSSIVASFIRAPKIAKLGNDIEVLATHNGTPVAIRNDRHIGLTFHPELNNETIFHSFLFQMKKKVDTLSAN